ncbi:MULTISPECIES: hypothetical protein [unclassified Bradyrhizobium]|uniref:hypothetical protein n=1 Tax=unclassified Bradyrhizobium TaxID=2631580 RepID=UPI001FFBBA3D|nr:MULTISPECIES: hypothetical protein [unclassified Bradyrhizobium]MCK1713813.1 hypothetical protein [Bradyrhizobium sp. 143]MCK1728013.1 hypothetical protein [Bradyrhizobium sp. 142]
MICELIGLACITAHGEIADAKLRDQWAADAPEPIVENAAPWPIKSDMTPFTGDYLTKADLIALNGKCGSILHQGSFKRLLTKKVPQGIATPKSKDW